MTFAKVALDVPLDRLFDYRCDEAGTEDVGRLVRVPFGGRTRVGVLLSLHDQSEIPADRVKHIIEVRRDLPALPPDIRRLLEFCSSYYLAPIGEAMLAALPAPLRSGNFSAARPEQYYRLSDAGKQVESDQIPARAVIQRKLFALLRNEAAVPRSALVALSPSVSRTLRQWEIQGWVEREQKISFESPSPPPSPPSGPLLRAEQKEAVAAITPLVGASFGVFLLHGVTGSGKTEVYLRLIQEAVSKDRQVLVLIPEINLTPQIETLFRQRFPGFVIATLHSGLNETEKTRHWLAAHAGHAQIVLGTRLSTFTPMPRLGLIIVDEEHDASFKQQDGMRYSARDVAIVRARESGVPIVLGSATPSLETYLNARTGRYRYLALTARAVSGATLPTIRCLDMRQTAPSEAFAAPLLEAISDRLQRREQTLVFINRRGFSPVLYCNECAWLSGCPRCSTRLVVHARDKRLRCHHCGHEERIPLRCPQCGNVDLAALGHGTQRLEEVLALRFPNARVLRIDRDSTRRKDSLRRMLDQVRNGEVDILVGTQMMAKGHDFPKLTLVGIVNPDDALYSSDFRAAEKLFAQLMQVSGRAGRSAAKGEVLIQTRFPDHPLYSALTTQDYAGFAAQALAEREAVGLPPYVYQAIARAEGANETQVIDFLETARRHGATSSAGVTLYDPVPAGIARVAGKSRAQLLVQSDSRHALHRFLRHWVTSFRESKTRTVRWAIDVDPLEI